MGLRVTCILYFILKEVVDEDGKVKYQKFRLPSLSRPSLYHEVGLYALKPWIGLIFY